jgi:hypothetical protein
LRTSHNDPDEARHALAATRGQLLSMPIIVSFAFSDLHPPERAVPSAYRP